MASNLKRSKRTVGRRILDLQTRVSGLQKRIGPTSIGQNAVSTSSLQPGAIGGWVVDATSIYTGVKTATGSFAPVGSITIGSDGHITANKFRIDANGDAFFQGAINGGTIDIGGFDSSSFHVDANGNMWLGAGTIGAATFSVTSGGTLSASGASISGTLSAGVNSTIGGWTAAADKLYKTAANGSIELRATTDPYSISSIYVNASDPLGSGSISTTELAAGSLFFNLTNVFNGYVAAADINGFDAAWTRSSGEEILLRPTGGTLINTQNDDNGGTLILKRAFSQPTFKTILLFLNGTNGEAGKIRYDGSATKVAYDVTSDARLKRNIESIDSALSVVSKMNPVSFQYEDTDNFHHGFIAQELYKVYDKPVYKPIDEEKEYWSIDYGSLTPILTAAVQELSKKVDALEEKLNSRMGE